MSFMGTTKGLGLIKQKSLPCRTTGSMFRDNLSPLHIFFRLRAGREPQKEQAMKFKDGDNRFVFSLLERTGNC